MLQKWKDIITNWINCYSNENTKTDRVTIESLTNIVSHLRENLNLDESKSSILEALTISEFVSEKYPEFKFENGTVNPSSEDELYLVASLLLFFVCVNSKDVDLKSAMCSNLSGYDQETILKFSKNLMEFTPITCRVVEAAITASCGVDSVAMETGDVTVSATPPALRSLHGEVRRLQAALDAERFDRNYLQEELSRTNLKLEKLLKDKEQYKLDIVNLKAKISMCCGQEQDSQGDDPRVESVTKFTRQLEDLEDRLVRTQELLDDAIFEKDTYKTKLDEVKQDRDKWLTFGQQESSRASKLAEELVTERRCLVSLQELVAELRQHNRLNRLDSSLLECDDPDTSVHSLQHNISVCSEACANIIEVQLAEERAKVDSLKQQMQSLQVQLNEINVKSLNEKETYEKTITEQNNKIVELKHHIDEEVDENNNLRNEANKLNNEINELEQKIKDNNNNHRHIMDVKVKEIQTLQEEKLSLLQSLSDETTKLETVISNLKAEIESEKQFKIDMRESYENQMMKLNDKVFNINNELVELQNSNIEKVENIEILQTDLNNEKELSNKYHNELGALKEEKKEIENNLQKMIQELEAMRQTLEHNNNRHSQVLESKMQEICILQKEKLSLIQSLSDETTKLETVISQLKADIESEKQSKMEMKESYENQIMKLNEKVLKNNNELTELQTDLRNEKELVNKYQNELCSLDEQKKTVERNLEKMAVMKQTLEHNFATVSKELDDCNSSLANVKVYCGELELCKTKLETEINKRAKKYDEVQKEMEQKEIMFGEDVKRLQIGLSERDAVIETLQSHLQDEIKLKLDLQEKLLKLQIDRENLLEDMKKINIDFSELNSVLTEKELQLKTIDMYLQEEKNTSKILKEETEKLHEEITKLSIEISNKDDYIKLKNNELESAKTDYEQVKKNQRKKLKKMKVKTKQTFEVLKQKLLALDSEKDDLKKAVESLNKEKAEKSKEVAQLKVQQNELYMKLVNQKKSYEKTISEQINNISDLKLRINKETDNKSKLQTLYNDETTKLNNEINELEQKINDINTKSQQSIECKMQEIQTLQEEKSLLLQSLSDETRKFETVISNLKKEIESEKQSKIEVKERYENQMTKLNEKVLNRSNEKIEMLETDLKNEIELSNKYHNELCALREEKKEVENILQKTIQEMEAMQQTLEHKVATVSKELDEYKSLLANVRQYCRELELCKTDLEAKIKENVKRYDEIQKTIKQKDNVFAEDMERIKLDLNEKNAVIDTLQTHLQDEIKFKVELQDEFHKLQSDRERLSEDLMKLNDEVTLLKIELRENGKTIEAKDRYLKAEKNVSENLKVQNGKLNEEITKLCNEISQKDYYIKSLNTELEFVKENIEKEISCYKQSLDVLEKKLSEIAAERDHLRDAIEVVNNENADKCKQISLFEVQLSEINLKSANEKEFLETIISEQDNDIIDLKHRINEERDENNNLRTLHNKEIMKLNNENNELEQKIQDIISNHHEMMESKMQEIQQLQEEKLTLLQTISDKTNKLETVISKLKTETESEKQSKIDMRESYENQMMKIKDKVLNRNNELVELQNSNFAKGERIEILQTDLRNEKALSTKCHNEICALREEKKVMESSLQKTTHKIEEMRRTLEHNINDHRQMTESKMREIETLEEEKLSLLQSLSDETTKLETVINKLKTEIELEKQSKIDMRESYENQMMKLNDKVLNRNNELVELQNSNIEKGEKIEMLQNDLKNEKELSNKYRNELCVLGEEKKTVENNLEKIEVMKQSLEHNFATVSKELDDCKTLLANVKVYCGELELCKTKFEAETNECAKKYDKIQKAMQQKETLSEYVEKLKLELNERNAVIDTLQIELQDEIKTKVELQDKLHKLQSGRENLVETINQLNIELSKLKGDLIKKEKAMQTIDLQLNEEKYLSVNLKEENEKLSEEIKKMREEISQKENCIAMLNAELESAKNDLEKEISKSKQSYEALKQEIIEVTAERDDLKNVMDTMNRDNDEKSKELKEKDDIIASIRKELLEERVVKEQNKKDLEAKMSFISKVQKNLSDIHKEREALAILRRENEDLIKVVGQREKCAVQSQQFFQKYAEEAEKELLELHHQVDNTSDLTHTSSESLKTITDLEMIIQDKNRTITALQSDVTYLKTLMAESETKLLDVTKELDITTENCHQLSNQLKKIVYQKNEEIAELKRQVSKMSANESRATQIIKVSAKYQAIILKRIAEIKSNTVLKELTNFGNSNNCDNELRWSLNAGTITMEDLENFLETTERHISKCSAKQTALQKERDRLTEINRIHESEIINLRKFLAEVSVGLQTFNSVREMYGQKLSRVVSVQRTVRREILSAAGHVGDACLARLERAHAAALQDLAECALQLERWAQRCVARTVSAEKLQQAFLSDEQRPSVAADSLQHAALEVQLDELEQRLQRLLEDATRATREPAPRDVTVTEVRAEYEDKLDRMKTKMKQLYAEQIAVFKQKQKEEVSTLEAELARSQRRLADTSRAYEEHIRALTAELWSVGEKFLVQRDEAQWLRRQRGASLMSLQHLHSSGLSSAQEEPSRPSDTHSLRSLPVHSNETKKKEGRGLHMSDEEGEVFDNRWLKELSATPRRESTAPAGQRLSELRWRNSLCPPHLKSSYPAETQFTHAVDEEDIKCAGIGRQQRKEVGITAYKKPGPPTPSKQAGRLSATDSELRESLRVEADPQPSRKTSTPSRIRALFRSGKNDTTEGTPRTRRLSNIFRKK